MGGGLSEFSGQRKKKKKDREGGGGQAETETETEKGNTHSIQCARLTAETAGNSSPNRITIYYIWKLEKRAHGSRLEIWTVLIRVELLRPILTPIRFN